MIIISKIIKFLKEHTLKAIFYGVVGIILGFLIALAVKNWKLFISVLSSVVKYEHFHIYIIFLIFVVVLFHLYKRTGKLKIEINKIQFSIKEDSSRNIPQQGVKSEITYFFSNNAKWKINLKTKSFDKNPYCICCKPPSRLIELPPQGISAFGEPEETHKCVTSNQEYYLSPWAYIYAYREAREKYRVHVKAIEDEMKRLVKTGKAKVKEP